MNTTVDTNIVPLISSKLSILEQPLNTLLNIEDVLIPKINYTSVKLAKNTSTSTSTSTDKYIISRNISNEYNDSITSNLDNDTYNYIVDDFQKIDNPEKETLEEIYTNVILEKQTKGESDGDEDIDILIQNITSEISNINDQIKDNITITQILLANTPDNKNYSDDDITFIRELTKLLNKYKNSILWNSINNNIN